MIPSNGASSKDRRLRIVYLAGVRNCGSTLLDAILGNAPEARGLGEVGGFHRFKPGAECSCGLASQKCGLCRTALQAAAAAGTLEEFGRVSPLPLRERRLHWAFFSTASRRRYAEFADALFAGVAEATDSAVLIDSSKNVSRAAALAHDSSHDVRIIHVVRDGRGHLASRRRRAAADGRRPLLLLGAATWLAKNLAIDVLLGRRLAADRYLRCRYEDLVADPMVELRRIGEFVGLDTEGLADAASHAGLERSQLFEPDRRTDYRRIRLDSSRLRLQRASPLAKSVFWALGGFISSRWGYDRRQSYLPGPVHRPPV